MSRILLIGIIVSFLAIGVSIYIDYMFLIIVNSILLGFNIRPLIQKLFIK